MQLAVGPAAAQVADQGHRVDEATLLHGERALLVGQQSLLGQSHSRVVDGTGSEFGERDLGLSARHFSASVSPKNCGTQWPAANKICNST